MLSVGTNTVRRRFYGWPLRGGPSAQPQGSSPIWPLERPFTLSPLSPLPFPRGSADLLFRSAGRPSPVPDVKNRRPRTAGVLYPEGSWVRARSVERAKLPGRCRGNRKKMFFRGNEAREVLKTRDLVFYEAKNELKTNPKNAQTKLKDGKPKLKNRKTKLRNA